MRLWLVVLTASLLAAGLGCGEKEESLPSDTTRSPTPQATESEPQTGVSPSPLLPTPTPGTAVLYRWVNVSVLVPDDPRISAGPGFGGEPFHFVIGMVDLEDSRKTSTVVLDSENGAIVEEEVLDEHREEIDQVLATLSVGPFDRSSAPWPYKDELTPDLVRENEGGRISWIRPSPSTGLYVGWGIADPGGSFVDLRNERSAAFVRFGTAGNLELDTSQVVAEDLPVFERWLATVKQCAAESKC